MTSERHDKLHEVFSAARRLGEPERGAYLVEACGDDAALLAEVEELLALMPDADEALQRTRFGGVRELAEAALGDDSDMDALPERVGAYKILRRLGEGGMGVVYEAEQSRPKRRVALKLLRCGVGSPDVLRRFERESELLARLQHPGIAQVYEAGVTRLGAPAALPQPYFAMELIDGLPLTEHAGRAKLNLRQRMELLAAVCDAVEHAHARGIVHRDLKPANILVDGHGRPKVLDFGVARAADPDGTLHSLKTSVGQVIGTVAYMSPEQASGLVEQVDARSDVHALGAIAFELLTGARPRDLDGLPLPEALRRLNESEPRRVASIDRKLKGDPDTIVANALERDRSRRYASVAELAADIRRYLNDEPIVARAPSTIYQLRKFTRRHVAAVCLGALALLSLLAGSGLVLRQAIIASRHEAQARLESYRAHLSASLLAIQSEDLRTAAEHLESAPLEHRGFEWAYLRGQLEDSSFSRRFPGAVAAAVSVRGDLHLAASVSDGRLEVHRFDPTDGSSLEVRRGAAALQWLDAAPPRGLRAWSALQEGVDALRGEPRPERERLVVRRADLDLEIVSVPGGRLRVSREGRGTLPIEAGAWSTAVEISPDGRLLATGGSYHVQVFDLETGRLLWSDDSVVPQLALCFLTPERLVAGTDFGLLQEWSAEDGLPVGSAQLAEDVIVRALAASTDGRTLVAGGSDGSVHVFGEDLSPRQDLRGDAPIDQLALSADASRVFALTGNAELRAWDLSGRKRVELMRGHESFVYPVLAPVGTGEVWSGSWDGTVRRWSPREGRELGRFPSGPEAEPVYWMAASPDGHRLATVSLHGTLRLHAMPSGEPLGSVSLSASLDSGVAFSPDGARIAVTGRAELQVRDARSLELLSRLEGARGSVAWSPDGSLIAVDGCLGSALLVDGRDLSIRRRLDGLGPGRSRAARHVSWSPDGERVLVTEDEGGINVFEAASGDRLAELQADERESFGAIYSPDGRRILAGAWDGSVVFYDAESFQQLLRIPGHERYVYSLAFLEDGEAFVSGSGDGTLRLWDARSPASAGRDQ